MTIQKRHRLITNDPNPTIREAAQRIAARPLWLHIGETKAQAAQRRARKAR